MVKHLIFLFRAGSEVVHSLLLPHGPRGAVARCQRPSCPGCWRSWGGRDCGVRGWPAVTSSVDGGSGVHVPLRTSHIAGPQGVDACWELTRTGLWLWGWAHQGLHFWDIRVMLVSWAKALTPGLPRGLGELRTSSLSCGPPTAQHAPWVLGQQVLPITGCGEDR